MPLQKLSPRQLKGERKSSALPEYLEFINSLKPGEGGRTTTAREGVSRQTVKTRVKVAADELGATIRFHRCPEDQVVFELIKRN